MDTVVEIRRASASDAAEILEVQKQAFYGQAVLYDDRTLPPLVQTLDELKRDFSSYTYLKAIAADRTVGSVRGRTEAGTCSISRLVVLPEYQQKGIGTILMRSIEKEFPKAVRYELFTGHKSAKNLAFYEKLGYRKYSEKPQSAKVLLICLEKDVRSDVIRREGRPVEWPGE